jgi:(p)ppGpp synthase/HD superfamily hydrolase
MHHIPTPDILDDIELERRRRLLGLIEPDPHADVLWRSAMAAMLDDSQRDQLSHAFRFAREVNYHHVGLTSEIYFSHPVRVAAIATLVSGTQHSGIGVLAVLHNVLEVSDLSVDKLSGIFGSDISSQIEALTVDRNAQWDRGYKAGYYRRLMGCPFPTRVVKIVDKLDNLFLLGINPDASVRKKYLAEVEDYVLPMTAVTLPVITSYLQNLILDCRSTGFIERPVAINQKEKS